MRRYFDPTRYRAVRLDRKSTRLNSSHPSISTISLHDALPIFPLIRSAVSRARTLRSRLPRCRRRQLHLLGDLWKSQRQACRRAAWRARLRMLAEHAALLRSDALSRRTLRSEEHTSELQSPVHLDHFPTRRSSDLSTDSQRCIPSSNPTITASSMQETATSSTGRPVEIPAASLPSCCMAGPAQDARGACGATSIRRAIAPYA